MSMFVGLVRDPRWEPPEGAPEPRWNIPWGAIAWVAVFVTMLGLVPMVGDLFGALAGYGFLCLAVAIGGWRFERWMSRQYWGGLKDYQA